MSIHHVNKPCQSAFHHSNTTSNTPSRHLYHPLIPSLTLPLTIFNPPTSNTPLSLFSTHLPLTPLHSTFNPPISTTPLSLPSTGMTERVTVGRKWPPWVRILQISLSPGWTSCCPFPEKGTTKGGLLWWGMGQVRTLSIHPLSIHTLSIHILSIHNFSTQRTLSMSTFHTLYHPSHSH